MPGEDDLAKITLSCSESSAGSLELIKTGGNIKMWQNATKGTEQTDLNWNLASETPPGTLWVEGTGASGSERDVQLELKYSFNGKSISGKVKATVVMINLGNAVYQENQSLGDPGHAALVTGYTGDCTREALLDAGNFQITHMPGLFYGVETDDLDLITDNDPWGCYTVSGMNYTQRLQILQNANDALNDGGITYTGINALSPANWNNTIASITDLRCDGFVEMCYEIDELNVWGHINNGGAPRYDIEDNTYQEEHNDYDLIFWKDNFMPATQCAHENTYEGTIWGTTFIQQSLCTPIGHTGG